MMKHNVHSHFYACSTTKAWSPLSLLLISCFLRDHVSNIKQEKICPHYITTKILSLKLHWYHCNLIKIEKSKLNSSWGRQVHSLRFIKTGTGFLLISRFLSVYISHYVLCLCVIEIYVCLFVYIHRGCIIMNARQGWLCRWYYDFIICSCPLIF